MTSPVAPVPTPPQAAEPDVRRVVLGFDGSEVAHRALAVAVDLAARRGLPLLVVVAYDSPVVGLDLMQDLAALAQEQAAVAVAVAVRSLPETSVEAEVRRGFPAHVLLQHRLVDDLLVLGSRGHNMVGEVMIGSTSIEAASKARCPVLVVRGGPTDAGPVVVGVEEAGPAHDVVRRAAVEARVRGTDLLLACAVPPVTYWAGTSSPLLDLYKERTGDAEQTMAALATEVRAAVPGLRVSVRVANTQPGAMLVEESGTAQLVVVGSRGRSPLGALLLGSVSRTVLHLAHCPVLVAHPLPAGHATIGPDDLLGVRSDGTRPLAASGR